MSAVNDPDLKLLVALFLVVILAAGAWIFWDDIFAPAVEPVIAPPQPAVEEAPKQTGPVHPIPSPEMSTTADGELVPLPPLDDSDAYFLLALIDLFGSGAEPLLASEALVDRFVATVDNLTRSRVAEKIRPVGRLQGSFLVDAGEARNTYVVSPDNFARYTPLVNMASGADLDTVVVTYRRFYPLFQESFERLGYPDAYFNDRVVEVIDHLLQTPEWDGPLRLVRPHVLYEFADVELEALSSGQKLLLRMGPENAAAVMQILRDFRMYIAQPSE